MANNLYTDLNIPPYFDDFDESKNFYKILFRPSTGVQARELNQMQTILQKQIDRFGQHIFKEGSIVLGGAFDVELDIPYVKVTTADIEPDVDNIEDFVGLIFTGQTSGISAYCRAVEYDSENNNYVLFMRYQDASTETDVFLEGETIVNGDTYSAVVMDTDATGTGSIFTIGSGVVFTKGFFAAFPTQTIVLERYSTTPTYIVGFTVTQSIIKETQDESLYDNSLGYPNHNAPGAHRFVVTLTLAKVDFEDITDDPDFITLFKIRSGIIEETEERSQYARIYEELAKRTYDESGDYYVNGLNVRTREHLDNGTNEGVYVANAGGNSSWLSIDVEPGTAYVKGYEINSLVTRHLATTKASTSEQINNEQLNARTGGYIIIKEVTGTPELDLGTICTFYDTAETRITSGDRNSVSPTGVVMGTGRVKSIQYESGTMGNANAQMKLFLFDIAMTNGAFSDIKSVYINDTNDFFADVVLTSNVALIADSSENDLIFPLRTPFVRSVTDNTGVTDTTFNFSRTEVKNINFDSGNGVITVSVATDDEDLAFSDGSLSTAEKREIIISVNADKNIELPGTVAGTNNQSNIIGTATDFTVLSVGNRIEAHGEQFFINSITNTTHLTTTVPIALGDFSANVYYKAYFSGDMIDLTANGSAGAARLATVSSGTLTIDINEDNSIANGNLSATITYPVSRSTGAEVGKTLKGNRYVQINCAALANLADPINLGAADVYQVRSVRLHTAAFTTPDQGSDVTDSFTLDNGQRDNHYDHGTIIPSGITLTGTDKLLVKFDFFEPDFSSGFGYFSVDSYPINDAESSNTEIFTFQIPKYTSSSGIKYDLRNCLDFRPVKTRTAADATIVTDASTNPATTTSFQTDSNGLRVAIPDSTIRVDYSYYLARRDVVTLDKDGIFTVVNGEPAIVPVSPKTSENVMEVANIYIPPYPSLSESVVRVLDLDYPSCISQKRANIRHTMRDIGVLKQRIENLEYYNALSLLEKSALDLKVLDGDGLDRFKNGVFVDGFLDHSLGATYNEDYDIAVDKIEQCLRPKFEMDAFGYNYINALSTSVQLTGNLLTSPYTETLLLEQPNVTTTRNIEQSVYRFIGTLELTPDVDTWIDETTVDKKISFGSQLSNTMTTEWGSWQTYHTGYNVYDRQVYDRSGVANSELFIGSFGSYAEAKDSAKWTPVIWPGYTGNTVLDEQALIETVESQKRTGIKTDVNVTTETQSLGNFVTDVSVIPYIKPQVIILYAKGLKARTRYYTYFDGENMSDYISPYVIPEEGVSAITTSPQAEGTSWYTDDFGELYGLLRLPATGKRFRVGQKDVTITDNPTNSIDATSYCKNYFVASGLTVKKQNTILSTKYISSVKVTPVEEFRKKQTTEIVGGSCMAYSFKIDVPPDEEGVFLTSVDVFIEAMHETLGVWFEIREMNSAGGITRNQVPYSEVWMKRDDPRIVLTDDGTEPTNVNFSAPVFLYNNTQYAFVIHTEGLNPDTYFWISRLGETDIITGDKVTSRKLTGTLFTTNNNLNYDMVPDVDLKIKFYRADFSTGLSGTALFHNKATEFLNLDIDNADTFTLYGENIKGAEYLTLSGVGGNDTIIVTDIITGANSGAVANVMIIDGTTYYTDLSAFSGFVAGEAISVTNSTAGAKDVTGTISTVNFGEATLRKLDRTANFMVLDQTNGKFFVNCEIRGEMSNSTAQVTAFDDWKYSTVNFNPSYLTFNKTGCTFQKRGYITNSSAFGVYYPGYPNDTSSYEHEKTILSRFTEIDDISANGSSQIKATMSTNSQYVSSVIDISNMSTVYIHNLINANTDNEDLASGGELWNKYISKTVTLANNQDAEDLIVVLSLYRPPGTDVKVWMKIRHNEDEEVFSDKLWIEMTSTNENYSSLSNKNDYIEAAYLVPTASKDANGVVQYTSNSNDFKGFKQFAVKIGLLGSDSPIVPKVADLRALALQL